MDGPPELADAATATDDRARIGPCHQEDLQGRILVVTHELRDDAREERGLDEYHLRIYVIDVVLSR